MKSAGGYGRLVNAGPCPVAVQGKGMIRVRTRPVQPIRSFSLSCLRTQGRPSHCLTHASPHKGPAAPISVVRYLERQQAPPLKSAGGYGRPVNAAMQQGDTAACILYCRSCTLEVSCCQASSVSPTLQASRARLPPRCQAAMHRQHSRQTTQGSTLPRLECISSTQLGAGP